MSDRISVTLPDGSERELPAGSTAADLAADLGRRAARDALVAEVDGRPVDLDAVLADGAKVNLVFPSSDEGLEVLRHSTAHVLAQAVLDLYPGATFSIGPPIEDGFYYDFDLGDGRTFSADDLDRIEARMREFVADQQAFVREEVDEQRAAEIFADHPYKREIIAGVAEDPTSGPEGGVISVYRNSDSFVDLCRGPHVPHTGRLGHFKLMRVAGAYWRGDETRPMLQRIYGTAWATAAELDAHLHRLEQAAERDHRRLGAELDLFSFPEEIGPGLVVWHPNGALVRSIMEDYSRQRHRDDDYQMVYSPHVAKSDLWWTSGHLDFYAENMFAGMEMDGVEYRAKPMNCPFHMLIFKARQRSYRELPLRLFELGTVYRYERSGVMHGLMRLRGFTQDDSHIFCTREQLPDELHFLLQFVLGLLRDFGFREFEFDLSTRPEGKSVGSDEQWEEATAALQAALERDGLDYRVDEGGGAFYGPKIDIHVKDAIGRAWQLSTLQVDFHHPQRFELSYVGPDNHPHQPVVVHRALFGSIERFFGVLVEHFGGAFPAWLAPVQIVVLPVRDDHQDYAAGVAAGLSGDGFRVVVDPATDPLGTRIRKHKLQKVPYVLVVGDEDLAAGTAGVNTRGGHVERGVAVEAFSRRLRTEVDSRATEPEPT